MSSLWENLYSASPAWGQAALLNVYGLRTRQHRTRMEGILATLRETERWEHPRQVAFVQERLRAILLHAVETVPKYERFRHLLRPLRLPGSDVFPMLQGFPVVTRQEIAAEPLAFRSKATPPGRLVTTRTSGTTGTPLTTWMTADDKLLSDALWWRRTAWAGYASGDWIARLVGDPVIPLSSREPRPAHRVSWTDRRLYFSSYHLNPDTGREILRTLFAWRPAFVMGYPSTLAYIAGLDAGDRPIPWSPKAVLYSSEPMFPHQREAIVRAFQAPIRSLYGCAERVLSAAECESGGLHLGLVDGYLEGQFGDAPPDSGLVTGLLNRVMPLIRYRIGDELSALPGEACPCGRTLPLMSPVVTKDEDCVVTLSGRNVSASLITWAFKDLPGVRKSQVIQESATLLHVLVDVGPDCAERVCSALRERLEEMVFHEMRVEVSVTADIDVSGSGKTRFVVSRISRAQKELEAV